MSGNTIDPTIADNKPAVADLTAGEEYHWCACGQSSNQPFCDGSHVGTISRPRRSQRKPTVLPTSARANARATPPLLRWQPRSDHRRPGRNDRISAAAAAPPPSGSGAAPTVRSTPEEPTVEFIHQLARDGLTKIGHHGTMTSMGVPRKDLPHWDDIQIMVAQMATKPLLDDVTVGTELVIGPEAERPLHLDIPLFVSDMSFGALSEEAKVALATGAGLAGTGICSGEGGMLPEEQRANSRYFYELASAQFGYREELLSSIQAFHFKGGQGAKTGRADTCPGRRMSARLLRSAASNRDTQPCRSQPSPTCTVSMTFVDSVTACASCPAAFPSA